VLTSLVLGTLTLIVDAWRRRTVMSGRVVVALDIGAIVTMPSFIVARISHPSAAELEAGMPTYQGQISGSGCNSRSHARTAALVG
jgi:hypothetical protein